MNRSLPTEPVEQIRIKARSESLEAKTEDPHYELVRKNTKLNAQKPSMIEDVSPRKSKSTKRVHFDDIVPSASQVMEEMSTEPLSITLTPLTLDTGFDLSFGFGDLMPELSFENGTENLSKEVSKAWSPLSIDQPMMENNTIIKGKRNSPSPKVLGYYMGANDSPASSDYSFDEEIVVEPIVINPGQKRTTNVESKSVKYEDILVEPIVINPNPGQKRTTNVESKSVKYEDPIVPTVQASDSLSTVQASDSESEFQSTLSTEVAVPVGALGEYMDLLEKFSQMEASYEILLEENKQNNLKHDDLKSRFSKLESMYSQSLQENKDCQLKLSSALAENRKSVLRSQKNMRGLTKEVDVLQTQCKAYRKQMEFYDREVF
jgi:hypothetical protein